MLIMSATPPAAPSNGPITWPTGRAYIQHRFARYFFLPSPFLSLPLPPSHHLPFQSPSTSTRPAEQTTLETRACRPMPCLRTQSRAPTEAVGSLFSQILTLVTPAAATMIVADVTNPSRSPPTRPCTSPLHRCLHHLHIASSTSLPIRQ